MRKSKFTEEQIIKIIKSVEVGQKVGDICRTNGISEQTYHRWKAKYGGLDVNEARRLKQLEDENRKLALRAASSPSSRSTIERSRMSSEKSGSACGTAPGSSLRATSVRAVGAKSRQASRDLQFESALPITSVGE